MTYTPGLNDVITVMSELQHNYSQLANNWFKIFFDTTPHEDVTLTWFDEDGNLETYTLPNRAWDLKHLINGNVEPEGNIVADKGSLYQNLANGDVYIKKTSTNPQNGWVKVASISDLDEYIIRGSASPTSQISAPIGTLYANTTTGELSIKQANGWTIISVNEGYIDSKLATRADRSLSNLTVDGENHFLNKAQVSNCILSASADYCRAINNTLVINAHTKFLFPNGLNSDCTLKNIELDLAQSRTFTNTSTVAQNNLQAFFTYDNSQEAWMYCQKSYVFYGETQPFTPTSGVTAMWFDSINNIWKYSNNGANWVNKIAVPICNFNIVASSGNLTINSVEPTLTLVKFTDLLHLKNRSVLSDTAQTITGAKTFTSTTNLANTNISGSITVSDNINTNSGLVNVVNSNGNVTFVQNNSSNTGARIQLDGLSQGWHRVLIDDDYNNINTALSNKASTGFTNITEEGKATVTEWMTPDWTNQEVKSWDTEYIADKNGWIYIYTVNKSGTTGSAQSDFSSYTLTIDGYNITQRLLYSRSSGTGTVVTQFPLLIPIASGSIYSTAGGPVDDTKIIKFIPCKYN